MNKDELLNVVKNWISLDDQIKDLQRRIREIKSEKKSATETLVETMKNNEIDCFELEPINLFILKIKVKNLIKKTFIRFTHI